MSAMPKGVGFYDEAVTEPSEVIPALKRAFDENAKGRPAYLEFICSQHPVHGGWVMDPSIRGWRPVAESLAERGRTLATTSRVVRVQTSP
jgi:hypothetical protein